MNGQRSRVSVLLFIRIKCDLKCFYLSTLQSSLAPGSSRPPSSAVTSCTSLSPLFPAVHQRKVRKHCASTDSFSVQETHTEEDLLLTSTHLLILVLITVIICKRLEDCCVSNALFSGSYLCRSAQHNVSI